jgi:hypothetical protein
MYRADKQWDSPYVAAYGQPSGDVTLKWRDTRGANNGQTGIRGNSLPIFIRLVRMKTLFSAYVSGDGVHWGPPFATHTTVLPDRALAGLIVTSRNDQTTSRVEFSHVNEIDAAAKNSTSK